MNNNMLRLVAISFFTICLNTLLMGQEKTIKLRIIQTSDVHGCFFPYDFIERKPAKGSLARVSTYIKDLRKTYGANLILMDNGDILQGQPTCYYCNYVKPELPNVAASVINYMGYDVQTIGNHDIETGHNVYDKWIKEVKCPMLAANIISKDTEKPYLKPYHIINRDGIKIAIIGMITPAIPNWLNEKLWEGMFFQEMKECALYWTTYLKKQENPDIIIGLFHSGAEGGIITDEYEEDASLRIAKEVPGFDLILYGHDHKKHIETIKNKDGHDVLCMDPSSNAYFICDAEIDVTINNGQIINKQIKGSLKDVRNLPVDTAFMEYFKDEIDSINNYVNKKIGTFKNSIYTRDSYFGSSAFCDFIQNVQLKVTNADVSFNAPLSFDACIKAGDVFVGDLFNLYKYENQIYTIKMTGKEIKNYLEMSYGLWTNTMVSKDDHIMLLNIDSVNGIKKYTFKNLAFNFDSAAGIDYEVDVTKPYGNKIHILQMSNGEPFIMDKWYNVAMNSYRGNGGGELLTRGAGIPKDSIKGRIIYESEHDQRYYIMKEIEDAKIVNPKPNGNWKFVPSSLAIPAIRRDKDLLFGNR